jgi:drug/metabolite transporter (DMT)-like permease
VPLFTALSIALAVVAVSFSAILIRLSEAPPLVLSFYRLALTVLCLLAPVLWRYRSEFRQLGRREWVLCLISGFSLALHFYTWITSLRYTTVASSTVLVTTNPFIVLLLSYWLLRERTTTWGVAGMALGVAGAVFIGWGDFRVGGTALYGDVLAFLGAVTVSGYLIAGRFARQRMSALLYSTVVYAIAAFFLLIFMLPAGVKLGPYPPREWLIFFGLAVLPTILGHTLLNWALKHTSAAVISMSVLGEPVVSSLLAWLMLAESPAWTTFVGGLILLAGIALFLWKGQRQANSVGTVG